MRLGEVEMVWKKPHAVNVRPCQVRLDLVVSIYYLVSKPIVIQHRVHRVAQEIDRLTISMVYVQYV